MCKMTMRKIVIALIANRSPWEQVFAITQASGNDMFYALSKRCVGFTENAVAEGPISFL